MVIFILNFLAVFLLASRAGLGQVQLSPPSLAVLQGAQARFNCSTAAPWVVMGWFLNHRAVITISAEHGTLSNSDSFTVINRTTARSTAWELVIWNVTRNHTGDVTCDFQNIGRQTATLSVQVAGTVVIDGGNVTGRKGGRVRFRCQASDWYPAPTVTWALGGEAVNQEVNNYTTSHAAAADGLFLSTSTLDLLAMVDTWVQCQASVPALPAPKTHRVFLTVGPGGDDQTMLTAVIVSVLTIPLLVLLIIAIICCCVNERKSRRTEDTRGDGRRGEVAKDRAGQGQDNLGYSWNEKTGVAPSELRSDRGPPISVGAHQVTEEGDLLHLNYSGLPLGPHGQRGGMGNRIGGDPFGTASYRLPVYEAPDSSGQGVYPGDFKTIRHATTV